MRDASFALFVVCILGYGAAFAWYTLDRFDLVNLIRDGYRDDAFYYFQIAHHMAEGRFSTFDGGLSRTNGYHPLWLFLITPLYWLFDKTEALFAIKALEIMLLAGGVAVVVLAARVARLPWILLFAALPALFAQRGMLWGLEAALVLFMLGLLMLGACLFARDPERWRWLLAAVAFALPWARLECAAVAVAATAALGFLEWSGRLSCADRLASSGSAASAPGRADMRSWRWPAVVPLAAAVAGVLVYFAYNGVVFGGVVPVSGAVKAHWAQQRWEQEGGYGLAENFHALVRLEAFGDLLTALEVCAYVLLVWWLARRSRSREDALLLAFVAGAFGLAAGHLAKFAHGVLSMHPDLLSQYEWYFVPAYLMAALVVPLRCWVGICVLRHVLGPRLPRTGHILRWVGVGAAGVVLLAKVDFAEPFEVVDRARGASGQLDVREYMGALVVNRLLPEGTLVGSWDGGVVGYFSRLPVVSLDGLANSYDHKEALADGRARALWRRHGIFHFANTFRGEKGIGLKETRLWEERLVFQESGSLVDGTATSRSGFELRVEERHLVYAKAPCTRDDIRAPFFLHVVAASRDDIGGRHFENHDFMFRAFDDWRDGVCLARVPLPAYDIAYVRTGQVVPRVDILFKSAQDSRLMGLGLGAFQFILYRDDPKWLSSPVARSAWFWETMTPHLEPQEEGVGLLVAARTAQAFAWGCTADGDHVAEWAFGGRVEAIGGWTQTADGLCASATVLPHGHLHPVRVRRTPFGEAVAGLVGGRPPAIRADSAHSGVRGFDVYLADDALVYVREACERADAAPPFFVRLPPARDHFDAGREPIGHDYQLDFVLAQYGDWLGEDGETGPCLAEVPLPRYRIAEIRTGQHTAEGVVWEGEIRLDQLTTEGA